MSLFKVFEMDYIPTGEYISVRKGRNFVEEEVMEVVMKEVGKAKNMADAKRKFGGYPILGK